MANGLFGGGNGSELTPYLIEDSLDLKAIENNMAAGIYYKLSQDINLGGANFEPIGHLAGTGRVIFHGMLDGDGYKIYNGTINYPNDTYIGLIAWKQTGYIKNLTVELDVTGDTFVGILTGRMVAGAGAPYIDNCHVKGAVQGTNTVGGLAGGNDSPISNCSSDITMSIITGSNILSTVGGLIGSNSSTISQSFATGSIVATSNKPTNAGGLVGSATSGTSISQCYSTVNITVNLARGVGGLVGNSSSSGSVGTVLENCSSNCTIIITGQENATNVGVGGLIGMSGTAFGTDKLIISKKCLVDTNITSVGKNIGGILGYYTAPAFGEFVNGDSLNIIEDCVVLNDYINCSSGTSTNYSRIIGAVGDTDYLDWLSNNYVGDTMEFQIEGLTQANFPDEVNLHTGKDGLAMEETLLQSSEFYINLGWDFNNIWSINNGVPYLILNPVNNNIGIINNLILNLILNNPMFFMG